METPKFFSTDEFAAYFAVKPQTVRVNLCKHGHFLGIRPVKLSNRLLLWPADAVNALLSGSAK